VILARYPDSYREQDSVPLRNGAKVRLTQACLASDRSISLQI